MEEIIEILVRRDGISREEAIRVIHECREALNDMLLHADSLDNSFSLYDAATDIVANYLGLEPDYLDILLM